MILKHVRQSAVFMLASYIAVLIGYLAPNLFESLENALFLPSDSGSLFIRLISGALSMAAGVCAFLSLGDYLNSRNNFKKYIVTFLIVAFVAAVFFLIIYNKAQIISTNANTYLTPIIGFSGMFVLLCIKFPIVLLNAGLHALRMLQDKRR
jgi:hypothetical protein